MNRDLLSYTARRLRQSVESLREEVESLRAELRRSRKIKATPKLPKTDGADRPASDR